MEEQTSACEPAAAHAMATRPLAELIDRWGSEHDGGDPEPWTKILSPDGELRAEVLVRTQQASVGLARDGIALKGVEASGIFSVVFKGARDGPSHYSVTMHGISGSAPGAVLDGLKFLHAFRPPNRFELRIAHGPQLAPAQEIPDGAGDPDGLRELVLICDALAEIQRHTPLPIRIPESISSEIATEWLIAAALLRGETVDGTWTDMPMTLEPGAALPDETRDQFMVMVTVPLAVTVGDLEVALGRRQLVCKTARLDPDSLGSERVRLTPGDDNMMTERRDHAGRVPGHLDRRHIGRPRATAHLWIEAPVARIEAEGRLSRWNRLFDTHPPIEERIAALREL